MAFDWFKRLFQTDKQTDKQTNELLPSDMEKESLQLGFAAGYTGRSIHDINSSLSRIETIMPSRDWLLVQFEELTKRLEEGDQRRLEILIKALESLRSLSSEAPEPLRTSLLEQIKTVEKTYEPTKKVLQLVQLVRLSKEASYKDLARKMGLTDSGFRSLVFMALHRTNELEVIKMGRTGKERGLRYKSASDETVSNGQTNVQDTENKPTNQE